MTFGRPSAQRDCFADALEIAPGHAAKPAPRVRSLNLSATNKRLSAIVTAAAIMVVAWYFRSHGLLRPEAVIRFRAAHPISAMGSFLVLYAVAAFAALPTLPLNLAAGLLWGPWIGGVLSAGGSTLGATVAFYSARQVFGRLLARRCSSRMVTWLQNEFEEKGWRSIAFLRLNPIFPTGVLNYLIGLTSIDGKTYVVSTFVFLLPPSVTVALIGSEVGTLSMTGSVTRWVQKVLFLSAILAALAGFRYFAKYLNYTRRA